ncbi:hypothetical protein LTR91_023581 [Friedmanniomyces endolithicus]|uniref:Uncharacterized protein n=1 Tax=Friedmanniomyces endolithicus TaxID=329885 RepID=A0AAN6H201_9PEZI|nr:hypothetical protein LTR57_025466 [Friedmanniomyces endolithicus]KAK0950561.1 hypothetical protein LTS01_025556 [Friedmanniomyces endolithicus]KAK0953911.1 hypothetical protein LTR91_023581 [Friedmanniomyces endolithicus]KAK1021002.1 hypothetical protein LTS16_026790 [Friedmanniomyces endolithicus]
MELDQILVEELQKMRKIGAECYHKPSRMRNRFGYERTPKDWTKIPTLVEDMNLCLNASGNWHTNLRQNPVLAMFMSNFSTMIEVAMRLESRPAIQYIILCDSVLSAKHMLLVMLVFQLLFKDSSQGHSVFMYMCVDEAKERIARRSPIKSKHMILCRDTTWYTALGMIESRYTNPSITVMINSDMSLEDIQSLFSNRDLFVCLTVCMDRVKYSHLLLAMIVERVMVQELIPGSDPDRNMVRITDAITCHPTGKTRIMYRSNSHYLGAFINSSTNMIRPMNLSGMCFDCRMVQMILSQISIVTQADAEHEDQTPNQDWSQSFAAIITKDAIIASLKRASNVPVFVGQRETIVQDSILISSVKLNELLAMYDDLYAFTHSAWRNLPTPPDCESVFVLMWMISAENYDVNHFTITWQNATSNTFVHLWSIVDRLRTVLESNSADWLVGPRNPVGYSTSMNLPGAVDEYLYPSESIVPPHVEVFSTNMSKMQPKIMKRDYDSNFSFIMSLTMTKPRRMIDPNHVSMHNQEMAFAMMNKASDKKQD